MGSELFRLFWRPPVEPGKNKVFLAGMLGGVLEPGGEARFKALAELFDGLAPLVARRAADASALRVLSLMAFLSIVCRGVQMRAEVRRSEVKLIVCDKFLGRSRRNRSDNRETGL